MEIYWDFPETLRVSLLRSSLIDTHLCMYVCDLVLAADFIWVSL